MTQKPMPPIITVMRIDNMKIKLWFYHEQYTDDKASAKIVPWHIKLDDETSGFLLRLFICEHEIEVPDVELLPEPEIKEIMVSGLRQQAKDLQAETHMKLKDIEEKIQQLLCLTNEVAA